MRASFLRLLYTNHTNERDERLPISSTVMNEGVSLDKKVRS